nr:MAG TPA: hypothetical protein [Bacteriophage sp.]
MPDNQQFINCCKIIGGGLILACFILIFPLN